MEKLSKIAQDIINSKLSDLDTIRQIEKIEPESILRNTREPKLFSTTPTIEQIEIYAADLEKYKIDKAYDLSIKKQVQEFKFQKNKILEQFVIDQSGLNDIPEQYRDKAMAYAVKGLGNDWYNVSL